MALKLSILVGMIFGLLGAIMAFLDFLRRISKAYARTRAAVERGSCGAAGTFGVLLVLSAILGYCLSRLLQWGTRVQTQNFKEA